MSEGNREAEEGRSMEEEDGIDQRQEGGEMEVEAATQAEVSMDTEPGVRGRSRSSEKMLLDKSSSVVADQLDTLVRNNNQEEKYPEEDCASHHTYNSDAVGADEQREEPEVVPNGRKKKTRCDDNQFLQGPPGEAHRQTKEQTKELSVSPFITSPHTFPLHISEITVLQDDEAYTNSVTVPVEVIISRCLTSVIAAQYRAVNAQLMDILLRAGLLEHLSALRRYLLMDSGDFADQLSSRLFNVVCYNLCPPFLIPILFVVLILFIYLVLMSLQLANPDTRMTPHPHELNIILETSLKVTGYDEDPLSKNLAFVYSSRPSLAIPKTDPSSSKPDHSARPAFNPHDLSTLATFHLDYTVPFPLTLVIDRSAREKYHELFSFLLSLKRVAHALHEIWTFCKRRKANNNEVCLR